MESPRLKFLTGLTLSLLFAGCASGVPERIDGGVFDKAQYDMDKEDCRIQVKNKFPNLDKKNELLRTPVEIPRTKSKNRPFSIMEFNTCMQLKGWKNF